MTGNSEPAFKVDRVARVNMQIQDLAVRAGAIGIRDQFLDCLTAIVENLQTDPLTWGDPKYHTQKPGGTVCQRVFQPLIVHYAVFEEEHAVLILDLDGFPGSGLE